MWTHAVMSSLSILFDVGFLRRACASVESAINKTSCTYPDKQLLVTSEGLAVFYRSHNVHTNSVVKGNRSHVLFLRVLYNI